MEYLNNTEPQHLKSNKSVFSCLKIWIIKDDLGVFAMLEIVELK